VKCVLVNYADAAFAPYQLISGVTAKRFGFADVRAFGPNDVDADFACRHASTLNMTLGAGCWLWKPYIVARTLASLTDGDILVYADAATHFVNPIDPLIALLERNRLDLLILGEGFVESQYTKRDAFVLMGADRARFVQSPQRFASCFVLRKSTWAVGFVNRYLAHAEDDRILTDRANTCGLPDYPGFIAHRHDQSILSLSSKLENVPVVARNVIVEGLPDRGQQIINHTRSHVSPREIVKRLLMQGVLTPSDLRDLTGQTPKAPLP